MKKKLLTCFVITIILLSFDLLGSRNFCSISCPRNLDGLFFNWLSITAVATAFLLVLSLLPRKMYLAWWNFAKIGLPVLFVLVTIQVYTMNLPNGGYNVLNFNLPILYSFYGIFILLSLIQIYRGYRKK